MEWLGVFLVLAALADPSVIPDSGLVESARVDVVEAWPFVVRPRNASYIDLCSNLGPDDIRVLENGEEVRVVSVDRAPPLTLDVLLLDTSASMTDPKKVINRRKGRQTKDAARAYVSWMLEDAEQGEGAPQELAVFTFDDDLLMRVPSVAVENRDVAREIQGVIQGITGGYATALNQSLHDLLMLLGTRPGRSTILLLSDGADTAGLRSYDDVLELATETNNVTIFPIGIGEPQGRYLDLLEGLAEISGGQYYWLRGGRGGRIGDSVTRKFAEIRDRLKNQLYVSYEAEPFGELAGENGDGKTSTRRKVRIASLREECRIPDKGYRPVRTVRNPEATDGDAGVGDEPGVAVLGTAGRQLRLRVTDRMIDGDPLIRYSSAPGLPRWVKRMVRMEIPEFDGVLLPRTRAPEEIVLDWLLEGLLPLRENAGSPPSQRETVYPIEHEINGKTFLTRRDELAAAVYESSPEYREWVRRKVGAELREKLRKRVAVPADLEGLRRLEQSLDTIVAERLKRLTPRSYRDRLAAWLDDVPAQGLTLALERELANRLLDGAPPAVADRVQLDWWRLHDWLLFPDRVRLITPLELICESSADRCGFYRIVLPRLPELPDDSTKPELKISVPRTVDEYLAYENAKVQRHPLGLMAVRWLLGLKMHPEAPALPPSSGVPELASWFRSGWRVSSIAHFLEDVIVPRPDPDAPRIARCVQRVEIDLVAEGRDSAEVVKLDLMVELTGNTVTETEEGEIVDLIHLCEDETGRPAPAPTCFDVRGSDASAALGELLEQAGLSRCRG